MNVADDDQRDADFRLLAQDAPESQRPALGDGEVDEGEVRTAFERARICVLDRGASIVRSELNVAANGLVETEWDLATDGSEVSAQTADRVLEECLDEEFVVTAQAYDITHGQPVDPLEYAQRLAECLKTLDIPVEYTTDEQLNESLARIQANAPQEFGECQARLGNQ